MNELDFHFSLENVVSRECVFVESGVSQIISLVCVLCVVWQRVTAGGGLRTLSLGEEKHLSNHHNNNNNKKWTETILWL